jgi:hypothetical protein
MSDSIRLEVGGRPWLPSSDAELTDTLIYNNGPIAGLLRQHGSIYFFRCVEGFGDTVHVWVYAHVSEHEADFLRSMRIDLWSALEQVSNFSPITVALATDEDGILLAMDLRPEKGVSLLESDVYIDFLIQYGSHVAKKGSKEEEAVFRLQDMASPL